MAECFEGSGQVDEGSMNDDLEQHLGKLEYREREIVKLRYGLGGGYFYTDFEIMHIFKISVADLHCILKDVEDKLGKPLPKSRFPHEGN
jgi:RNA polymerase primary sigma factor